jgi:hypothetical protein
VSQHSRECVRSRRLTMNLAIFDCCDCRSGKGLTGDDNLDGLGNLYVYASVNPPLLRSSLTPPTTEIL